MDASPSTSDPKHAAGRDVLANGASVNGVSAVPRHIAIIMDGNGRWATARGLPRVEGHRVGVQTVRKIVEESRRLGIRYLTLYAFSAENWGRPEEEVNSLMGLFATYLESELDLMLKNQVRLRMIGDREKLPAKVLESLERSEAKTKDQSGMDLVLAISYGARQEILHAAKKIAAKAQRGELTPESLTIETFAQEMYAPEVPDPDLLIRTSDENRISNFLLWQLAYSEIVVSPVLWPEFSIEEYHQCIKEFAGRNRRFGLTGEQAQNGQLNLDKGSRGGRLGF